MREPRPVLRRRPAVEGPVGTTDPVVRPDALEATVLVGTGRPSRLGAVEERSGDDPARTVVLVDDQPPSLADDAVEENVTAGQSTHATHHFHIRVGPPPGKCADHRATGKRQRVMSEKYPRPRFGRGCHDRPRPPRPRIVAQSARRDADPPLPAPTSRQARPPRSVDNAPTRAVTPGHGRVAGNPDLGA